MNNDRANNNMKRLLAAVCFLSVTASAAEPQLPLPSGKYVFQHKFAEHPDMQSISLSAVISGKRIVVRNEVEDGTFPKGVLTDGTLMWHEKSKQWFIGFSPEDQQAKDVGSCSDGPEVVDLQKRIYWTC